MHSEWEAIVNMVLGMHGYWINTYMRHMIMQVDRRMWHMRCMLVISGY